MPAFALGSVPVHEDLHDAREALAFWEHRARTLPRRAVRRRREAREHAARWSTRIDTAERARYGRGVLGALALVAFEGRAPERVRRGGRVALRRTGQVASVVAVACLSVFVVAVALVVQLVAALV